MSLNITGTKIRPVWLDRLVKIWPFQKLCVTKRCHGKSTLNKFDDIYSSWTEKWNWGCTSHWTRRASLVNRLGRLRSWLSMMHTIQRQCNDYHYHHQTITDSCLFQGLMEILDEFMVQSNSVLNHPCCHCGSYICTVIVWHVQENQFFMRCRVWAGGFMICRKTRLLLQTRI